MLLSEAAAEWSFICALRMSISKQVQAKLKLTGVESIYLVAVSCQHSLSCKLVEVMQVSWGLELPGTHCDMLLQSGEKMTKLADLQDIDELHVLEVHIYLPIMLCRCLC